MHFFKLKFTYSLYGVMVNKAYFSRKIKNSWKCLYSSANGHADGKDNSPIWSCNSVTVSKGIRPSCLPCLFSIISKCSLQACAIEPRPINQRYWVLASEGYTSVCVVFICQRLLLVLHASPVSAVTVRGALCACRPKAVDWLKVQVWLITGPRCCPTACILALTDVKRGGNGTLCRWPWN